MTPHKKAHLFGLGFASIFGLTFMFSKTALDYVSPIGLLAYRFLFAFMAFYVLKTFNVIKVKLTKNKLKPLLLVGLFQPVLYFLFETYGLFQTTSAEAGMMIALIPIVVSVLSALILKEKPTLLQVLFIVLSVSGVVFIQVMEASQSLSPAFGGYLLLFLAVLSASFYNIASRQVSVKASSVEITYFMMIMGAIFFNGLYLTRLLIDGQSSAYVTTLFQVSVFGPVLYLGVIGSIGGFGLLNYALSQLEAHVISIYANIATVVAILAGYVFLQEALQWYHFVGAVMIIFGVYGTVRLQALKKKRQVVYKNAPLL